MLSHQPLSAIAEVSPFQTPTITPCPSHLNFQQSLILPEDQPEISLPSSSPQSENSDIDSLLSESLERLEFYLDSDHEDSDDEDSDSYSDFDEQKYVQILDENFCTGQLVEWVPGSIWEPYAYGHQ